MVALAWHLAFARVYQVSVDPISCFLLVLSVWVIYVADRLLDVRDPEGYEDTARHAFHARHGRALSHGLVIALILSFALLQNASGQLLIFGSFMVALCLVYGWLVHQRWPKVPKEFLCGGVFSVGVVGPLFIVPFPWIGVLNFALLCTANCLVISHADAQPDPVKARRIAAGLMLLTVAWSVSHVHLLSMMSVASIGLIIVHLSQWPREMKRVLADVCLLIPLVVTPP